MITVVAILLKPAATVTTGFTDAWRPWSVGRRGASAGYALDPGYCIGAMVQVYSARIRAWLDRPAIHT